MGGVNEYYLTISLLGNVTGIISLSFRSLRSRNQANLCCVVLSVFYVFVFKRIILFINVLLSLLLINNY